MTALEMSTRRGESFNPTDRQNILPETSWRQSSNIDPTLLPARPAKSSLRSQYSAPSCVETTATTTIPQALEAIQHLNSPVEEEEDHCPAKALSGTQLYDYRFLTATELISTLVVLPRYRHTKSHSLPTNCEMHPASQASQSLDEPGIVSRLSMTINQPLGAVAREHTADTALNDFIPASVTETQESASLPEANNMGTMSEAPHEPSKAPGPPPLSSTRSIPTYVAVVALMEEDRSPTRQNNDQERAIGGRPPQEQQRARTNQLGPTALKSRSRDSVNRLTRKASGFYKQGIDFLRPAPAIPALSRISRYTSSGSRTPFPSPLRGTFHARSVVCDEELVEIPRFKMRELNLAIVARRGPWRALWVFMWACWTTYGLLSLYLDVNIVYILVQCVKHPASGSTKGNSWIFATSAYIICCAISTPVVWLGWELFYEWWRRWRLPRPAIEPIYLSLPATIHLSLASYDHFVFLAHVRCSPLGTRYARDAIFETCHLLVQLAPGLVPLMPRAAVGIVILLNFSTTQELHSLVEATPRDPHFFRLDSPGQLTLYARGVSLAFVACVGLRVSLVLVSCIILLCFASRRPLGGLLAKPTAGLPTTSHRSRSFARDPSNTPTPAKSWLSAESDFDWPWKERTRARIQDAFELCMIRRDVPHGVGPAIPWGRSATTSLPIAASSKESKVSRGDFSARSLGRTTLNGEPARPRFTTEGNGPSSLPQSPTKDNSSTLNPRFSSQDVFPAPLQAPVEAEEFPMLVPQVRYCDDLESISASDSTALLSAAGSPQPNCEVSSDSHFVRQSAVRRPASSTAGATGRALLRARSTSVSLLNRGSPNGLVKRARSGTVLSAESAYCHVDGGCMKELAPATGPRRPSKLGALGSGHPVVTEMRSTTA